MDFETVRLYDRKILKSDDSVLKSTNLKILQSIQKKSPNMTLELSIILEIKIIFFYL